MKMKFSINNYTEVFNRVGPGYGGLAKFTIFSIPGEEYNYSFTNTEFHTVSSAPTLHKVNVRL
jgi:hypothetical protein